MLTPRREPLPPKHLPDAYRGLNYEQASRKGLELVTEAAGTQRWCHYVDALVALRDTMRQSSREPVAF